MLWMNEMKVQLKTWNADLGICRRTISLDKCQLMACLELFDLDAYHL
jgi:hypothetical protein